MARYTRNMIIRSFMSLLQEKTLDKITVKDVIEKAEVNRNTFYYHFKDLYDLLDTIFNDAAYQFIEETNEDNTFYEEYIRAANIFLENRKSIIHIYKSKNTDVLNRYLEISSNHFVERFVNKAAKDTDITKEGIEYITHFYSYSIVGNTMHWIANGMPEYRKNIILDISNSFEATIDIMIQTYINHHC